MRKNLFLTGMAVLLASQLLANPLSDMEFLGYSKNFVEETRAVIGLEKEPKPDTTGYDSNTEADHVQEQLTELGRTRALRTDLSDRSLEIRNQVNSYWNNMEPDTDYFALTDELKSELLAGMREALALNNFKVIQLELLDLPEGSNKDKFRAVVRATRPLKTKNTYKEIQNNLNEIRRVCSQAATIDGICYLSELTTFVAENPKNRYYYEKTILKY
jgi:hypothetical protein